MIDESEFDPDVQCPPCPECGIMSRYYTKWDAMVCQKCNTWIEGKCGATTEDECHFGCWKRPERPFELK